MITSVYKIWTAAAVAIAVIWPAEASAQATDYPSKPIRIVNPFAPGGGVDIMARFMAQKLNEAWGQPVIVDNRPGAGTTIGTEIVTRAAPDGYTLLVNSGGTIAVNVSLYPKLRFDPVKDLDPVVLVVQTPLALAVHPSVPAKSVRELIDVAKAKPGQLTFASSGTGTSTHLTMEMFSSLAKIKMLHVPYKGGAAAVNSLLGGEVNGIFIPITLVLPHAQAGKLRLLAVTSTKRVEFAPEFPTVAESGMPGFDVIVWYPIFAPAGTPREIVNKINSEINRMLQQPQVRKHFLRNGMVPVGGTPAELGDYLKREIALWAKVVKEAGVKLE